MPPPDPVTIATLFSNRAILFLSGRLATYRTLATRD
jgi:hypothetical protein